jgi:hypothetical protein
MKVKPWYFIKIHGEKSGGWTNTTTIKSKILKVYMTTDFKIICSFTEVTFS